MIDLDEAITFVINERLTLSDSSLLLNKHDDLLYTIDAFEA